MDWAVCSSTLSVAALPGAVVVVLAGTVGRVPDSASWAELLLAAGGQQRTAGEHDAADHEGAAVGHAEEGGLLVGAGTGVGVEQLVERALPVGHGGLVLGLGASQLPPDLVGAHLVVSIGRHRRSSVVTGEAQLAG